MPNFTAFDPQQRYIFKALIGLDFFRRFRVTIDYSQGVIVSNTYH